MPLAAAVKIPRIVLDSGTVAHLLYHLEVIFHPLLEPFGLQLTPRFDKVFHLRAQVVLNLRHRGGAPLLGGHEVPRGIYAYRVQSIHPGPGLGVYKAQGINLIAEKFDSHRLVCASQIHVHRIAPYTEGPPFELGLGAVVKGLHKAVQQPRKASPLPSFHLHGLGVEVLRVADTVQAGHRRDDYHIPAARQQRAGCRESQFLNLVVDAQVLFDIGVARRDVGLGLVVVVVRDEILHGIVGEERLEFSVQLCGQSLVMAQNQGGPLEVLDDIGHSEGLAGARDAQQGHRINPLPKSRAELLYGFGLVSGRSVGRIKTEFHRRKVTHFQEITRKNPPTLVYIKVRR